MHDVGWYVYCDAVGGNVFCDDRFGGDERFFVDFDVGIEHYVVVDVVGAL